MAMAETVDSKYCLEFAFSTLLALPTIAHGPPFSTSPGIFWQLAVNREEVSLRPWRGRDKVRAAIRLKDPTTGNVLVRSAFSPCTVTAASKGVATVWLFENERIPDAIVVCLDIHSPTVFEEAGQRTLNFKPIQQTIVHAWEEQLDTPEVSDVCFDVQGTTIYANTAIISASCDYFRNMFDGRFSESAPVVTSDVAEAVSNCSIEDISENENDSKQRHDPRKMLQVKVPDACPQAFLVMLRYLYTGQLRLNSEATASDVFRLADKYGIERLAALSRMKVIRELNIENAAETLFSFAWMYPELKEHVLAFILKNFAKIKNTEGFRNVIQNPANYAAFSDLTLEIFNSV